MNKHVPQQRDAHAVRPASRKAAGPAARAAGTPDPVLAALVKWLAKAAAERDYDRLSHDRRPSAARKTGKNGARP